MLCRLVANPMIGSLSRGHVHLREFRHRSPAMAAEVVEEEVVVERCRHRPLVFSELGYASFAHNNLLHPGRPRCLEAGPQRGLRWLQTNQRGRCRTSVCKRADETGNSTSTNRRDRART